MSAPAIATVIVNPKYTVRTRRASPPIILRTAIRRVRADKKDEIAPPAPIPAISIAAKDTKARKLRMFFIKFLKLGAALSEVLTLQPALGNALSRRLCHCFGDSPAVKSTRTYLSSSVPN